MTEICTRSKEIAKSGSSQKWENGKTADTCFSQQLLLTQIQIN